MGPFSFEQGRGLVWSPGYECARSMRVGFAVAKPLRLVLASGRTLGNRFHGEA
jgi:hypothetical protein